jgi:peptidylprolyl isomerase
VTGQKDYYAVLDINPQADRRAIAEAYERMARRYQPDENAPPTDPQRMRELDEAFDVLDDPERRAQYDRLRARSVSVDDPPLAAGAGWAPVPEEAGAAKPVSSTAARAWARRGDWIAPALFALAALAFLAGGLVLFLVALGGDGERTVTLTSGLRYTETEKGSGAPPGSGDGLAVHYTGTLEDGTVFDSSRDRDPLVFVLGRGDVIEGWDLGFATMRVGGKRTLIVPPDLGFGPEGTPGGPIPPNATLTFDVELLEIQRLGREVTTASGLRYIDLEPAPYGAATPQPGDEVVVHYTGSFPDGTQFVNTQQQGQPDSYILGSGTLTKGFEEGVLTMKIGGLRRLIIPPELGYGDQFFEFTQGDVLITIEPNTTLIFEVKLISAGGPSANPQ